MRRAALHTLGCKLNFAETSTLGRQFAAEGFAVVDIDESADVVVINTCSVTERADRECRQLVRRALRRSPAAYVVVVGCYAQLQPDEIAAIDGVDLVVGTAEKFNLFRLMGDLQKRPVPMVAVGPIAQANTFQFASSAGMVDRTRSFLKVQDGCDYTCAFCTIPLARGESRSVSVAEVFREASTIAEAGYKEIVLTGVNVGDYGRKSDSSLLQLLRGLVTIDGLERIRISSIEPNLLTDELLDLWFTERKLCKHWHVPMQGGSDELLKGMRRRYMRDWYEGRIQRIKEAVPDAGIGADVIAGFPGETDEIFEETYRFIRELPLTYLHVFTYSERPNTPAIGFAGHVEPRIRFERSDRLRGLSLRKRRSFHETVVGSTMPVLFESASKEGWVSGLTEHYIRVDVQTDKDCVNRILPVTITVAESEKCVGIFSQERVSFNSTVVAEPN